MRIPLSCALAASLLIGACAREEAPPPVAATPAASVPAPDAAAPAERIFSEPELEQMVAPVALYPDPLLAQVLMGATYPGDIADAAAWVAANPDATGDAAVARVADQPWDPSVQALVGFPQALATLGQDPAWVQRLGDAFLAQPEDVMDAVQRLRRKAQDAGNLASNEYQNVSTQPAAAPAEPLPAGAPAQDTIIIIEPSQPETVYVPSYNPTVVYGGWGYPSYPPAYYPTPYYYPGAALVNGMMWGAGIAIGASLWGDLDWNDNDINIDIDNYNSINRNNQINRGDNTWNHNAANRDGVPYRDKGNRERNGRQLDGASSRDAFRGEDAKRSEARNQARASMNERGIRPATDNRDARNQARTAADRGARDLPGASTDRAAQRDRAAATADRSAQRDRANAATSDRSRNTAQDRSRQQAQTNARSRDSARQQQTRQAPRNNAFEGASRPSSSQQAQQRGQTSQRSAGRPSSSHSSGGRQVSRPSNPPQRSGGGRHR